jgi:hypothetical protein
MMQKKGEITFVFVLSLGLIPAWGAEPASPAKEGAPLESITVTASKPTEAAINGFVTAHATPTRVAGKLARWKTGICPLTVGLAPLFAKYVTQRVRDVAASVGAPVDKDASCKANIQIVFTTTPQALLDNVRKDHPIYLGYFDNRLQSARLATVTHAIQSWYSTATSDLHGHPEVDTPNPGGVEFEMPAPAIPQIGLGGGGGIAGTYTMNLPYASIRNVTGGRLGDGLSSEFYSVIIVAEPAKLLDFEVGTVADYIAMLALSQPGSVDDCQQLPSITNILSPGCSMSTRTITDGDLAYLRGLYKMTPDSNLQVQRDEVRYQMEQVLKPKSN